MNCEQHNTTVNALLHPWRIIIVPLPSVLREKKEKRERGRERESEERVRVREREGVRERE